jgi:hypothetical protein
MKRATTVFLLTLLLASIAWVYLFTGTPPWGQRLVIKDTAVTSIALHWVGTDRAITSSEQCAEVIRIMRKARQSPAPTTPAFGNLSLHYADGTTNTFYLSPSGRSWAMELAGESGDYAVSMGEMVGVLERVGLLRKDRK